MNGDTQSNPAESVLRTVRITDLDKKGQGWGDTHTGGRLKVPYTIPGELVEARKMRRHEGCLLRVIEPSPFRIEPACRHFGSCGGCTWQHMDYEEQLRWKSARVARKFAENQLLIPQEPLPIESGWPYEYRSRMDFLWWYNGDFGLRQRGKWYSAVNLEECRLLPQPVMNVALEVNRRVQALRLPFRDSKCHTPGLRYLIVRRGAGTGEIMLSFVTDPMVFPSVLWQGLEDVVSVYQLINDNLENDLSDGEPVHLWGEPFYHEKINGGVYRVGPRSFFQPNPVMAERMVNYVQEIATTIDPRSGLIDLYCGIGLFAISLMNYFERIMGVENSAEAVALAKSNACGLPIRFACVDAEKWNWPERSDFDTLLVDPPRTGLQTGVLGRLQMEPFSNLIYVSCNPSRGVEDIAVLREAYEILSVKLFDQFPQTPHVEMIAHLRKKA